MKSVCCIVLASFSWSSANGADLTCYEPKQVEVLAKAITDLKSCRATLELREKFIESADISLQPSTAWWQEPTVILSGVVVSFSLGTVIGVLGARR